MEEETTRNILNKSLEFFFEVIRLRLFVQVCIFIDVTKN